ncbi:YciI family protein [Nocardioides sp. BP30]|uniref:YciI family protein n=1 Tax=Nocardioides sp. BP30 TaxID=3036374 RepID=UPI002469B312|nr:YciI family protein [Nocardioides sp. BP30]WGL52941.1 YciI family protein [Nocardioides sp. BP30]
MSQISVVLYEYGEGTTAVRDELRPAHRDFLDSREGLVLSGPTAAGGAVIVYEADPVELEAWLDSDPFWTAGAIAERVVTEWTIAMGSWKERLGL